MTIATPSTGPQARAPADLAALNRQIQDLERQVRNLQINRTPQPVKVGELLNVDPTADGVGLTGGETLVYDAATGTFKPGAAGTAGATVGQLQVGNAIQGAGLFASINGAGDGEGILPSLFMWCFSPPRIPGWTTTSVGMFVQNDLSGPLLQMPSIAMPDFTGGPDLGLGCFVTLVLGAWPLAGGVDPRLDVWGPFGLGSGDGVTPVAAQFHNVFGGGGPISLTDGGYFVGSDGFYVCTIQASIDYAGATFVP